MEAIAQMPVPEPFDLSIMIALLVFLIAVDVVVVLVVIWFVVNLFGDAAYAIKEMLKRRRAKKDRSKWQA